MIEVLKVEVNKIHKKYKKTRMNKFPKEKKASNQIFEENK